MALLDPEKSYTFRSYFEMRIDAIDLAPYFGYSLVAKPLALEHYQGPLEGLPQLSKRLIRVLPRLVSRNEQAKREMLVAPMIEEATAVTDALLRVEHPIKVSHQLQGEIDYLLSIGNLTELLVVEAKRDDLDYGFTQLMAEMIAVDQWERSPTVEQQSVLTGAVTTGTLWQFGVLDRKSKVITQGLNTYRVPEELEEILRILIHKLRSEL